MRPGCWRATGTAPSGLSLLGPRAGPRAAGFPVSKTFVTGFRTLGMLSLTFNVPCVNSIQFLLLCLSPPRKSRRIEVHPKLLYHATQRLPCSLSERLAPSCFHCLHFQPPGQSTVTKATLCILACTLFNQTQQRCVHDKQRVLFPLTLLLISIPFHVGLSHQPPNPVNPAGFRPLFAVD
jgi:hypothetical protein